MSRGGMGNARAEVGSQKSSQIPCRVPAKIMRSNGVAYVMVSKPMAYAMPLDPLLFLRTLRKGRKMGGDRLHILQE